VREPTVHPKRWWNREDVFLLVLLGILFFLPGLHRIPLFDRDEPRFASAARTMLESRDFIVPYFNGQLRPDKPPLVYWLMDLGYLATGGPGELGARLPSALCGTLSLIIVYFMVGSRFGRLTGFVAALMLGSCPLFLVESRMATADATMLLGIVVAMACAWQAWDAAARGGDVGGGNGDATRMPRSDFLLDRSGQHAPLLLDHLPPSAPRPMPWAMALVFWVALAFGTLAKGVPVAFVFVPMVVLSLTTRGGNAPARRGPFRFLHWNWAWWRQLRPAIGLPLLLVLVGWWVVLAGQATHWKLIQDMVGTHFLNRIGIPTPDLTPGGAQDAMKSYAQPPGFFLLAVWATFWPWSVLLIPAGFHTWRRLRGKTAIAIDPRPYQFLVAWIIPMWILLELARGKLFHYPLPCYVPLAILCADTLVQSWNRLTDVLAAGWFAAARWVTLVIWLALGLAVLLAAQRAPDAGMLWRCLPFALALMATGAASALTWGKVSWPYVLALCWGGSIMVGNVTILQDLPELQVSRIAGTEMKNLCQKDPSLRLGVCGYEEATLIFYSGHDLARFKNAADLIAHVPFARRGWESLWPARDPARESYVVAVEEKVRKELDRRHILYTELPRIPGFNVGTFKPVTITLISNQPPPPSALPTRPASEPASPATLPQPEAPRQP
jgi:4-amino-4-deoxy-L-arabinose transferase-like glycosyltransferase